MTLNDVCTLIGGKLVYHERDPRQFPDAPLYVTFEPDISIRKHGCLCSTMGDGRTRAECRKALAASISYENLAANAYSNDRFNFKVKRVTTR